MARIVVTGGAGFIGSHLAAALAKEGHDVTIFDNLDAYYPLPLKMLNLEDAKRAGCSFVKGDILDERLLSDALEGADVVFHQAAQPGVRASVEDPLRSHGVNATGTLAVLEAARKADVDRVINASSSSVYGEAQLPLREEHAVAPISPYGASKLIAEHYARIYHVLHGMKTVSLRYFTVYGPRMRPDLAIPLFLGKIRAGTRPRVFGDGNQSRDFTHISDVVRLNVALVDRPGPWGEALNVGAGARTTVNELLQILGKQLGKRVEAEYVSPQKGDVRDTLASTEKAARLLGYSPKVPIREGVRDYVTWYLAHEKEYA